MLRFANGQKVGGTDLDQDILNTIWQEEGTSGSEQSIQTL